MVANHCATELWNVVFEVDKVLALLMGDDVVKVDVFVAPFEVVDDALVRQLLLHDEDVLEKVNYPLVYVEVVELGDHGFLVFQVALVVVDQGVALVNHTSNVVKCLSVSRTFQFSQSVIESLVLSLLAFEFEVHVLDLGVIAL